MTLGDQVRTAVSNLGRRKVRTVLTSIGVVVGSLTIVVMVSLATGVREQINKQFQSVGLDRVTVQPPGGAAAEFDPFGFSPRTKIITPADVEKWGAWPGVVKVTPRIDLPFYVQMALKWKGKLIRVTPTSAGSFRGLRFGAKPPEAIEGSLDPPAKGGVVLSEPVAKLLEAPGQQLKNVIATPVELVLDTERGDTQNFPLTITGISSDKSSSVTPSTADCVAMKSWWFNEPDLLKTEGYDVVILRMADVSAARDVTPRLKKAGLEVESIEQFLDVANRIFTVITLMLSMVGGLALFVASIGIANTMVMAIYERTREIGILKAMGASPAEIRRMFMMEAGLIGLIGGVMGLIGGWVLGRGLNRVSLWYMKKRQLNIHGDLFLVTRSLAIEVLLFATVIGLVAGLYPAQRAARLDPLEGLRHE